MIALVMVIGVAAAITLRRRSASAKA
jgi:hypothetical protein